MGCIIGLGLLAFGAVIIFYSACVVGKKSDESMEKLIGKEKNNDCKK